jgi:hypothetical protein
MLSVTIVVFNTANVVRGYARVSYRQLPFQHSFCLSKTMMSSTIVKFVKEELIATEIERGDYGVMACFSEGHIPTQGLY